MNPTDADALAKRIINTWRGGPPLLEWIDALTDLDTGTAGTAFIRLRNDTDHTPSIATFMTVYRSLNTAANDPIGHPACGDCGRTGWTTAPELDHAGNTCVTPCRCPAGRHAETIHAKIDDHRRTKRQGPYSERYDRPEHRRLQLVAPADLFDNTTQEL